MVIEKFNENWIKQFVLIKDVLKENLSKIISIEHVGSTSIKGMYAKPIIDIDIISYSNLKIKNKKLTIPHPKMHLRKFVLEPLSEVSPNFYHIILHQKIENLLQKLL